MNAFITTAPGRYAEVAVKSREIDKSGYVKIVTAERVVIETHLSNVVFLSEED